MRIPDFRRSICFSGIKMCLKQHRTPSLQGQAERAGAVQPGEGGGGGGGGGGCKSVRRKGTDSLARSAVIGQGKLFLSKMGNLDWI